MPKNRSNPTPDLTCIRNLTCIRANLKKAIANRETVQIGGGGFGRGELRSLLMAVDSALANADDDPCESCEDRGWLLIESGEHGHQVQACDCGKLPGDDEAAEECQAFIDRALKAGVK